MLATDMRCMCNNNLQIRIVGSSSRQHNLVIAQNKTKYLNNQLYINTSESIDQRNEVIKKYQFSPNLNGASGVFLTLYYYMRNFCNLIGLEQWYFSLI